MFQEVLFQEVVPGGCSRRLFQEVLFQEVLLQAPNQRTGKRTSLGRGIRMVGLSETRQ